MIGKFQKRVYFLLSAQRLKTLYNIELTMIGEVSNKEHKKTLII